MQRRLFLLGLAASPAVSQAIEEPDYTVERVLDEAAAIELRRYAAYTVAEVTVSGPGRSGPSTVPPVGSVSRSPSVWRWARTAWWPTPPSTSARSRWWA